MPESGMMAALSFAIHWWPWIVAAVVATAALGYAAFILRNWKLALGAAAVVGLWIAAQWLWTSGYQAKVAEDHKAQMKVLRDRIALQEEILTDYDAAKERDDARIAELEKQVNDTPANGNSCLDRAGAGRVRRVR